MYLSKFFICDVSITIKTVLAIELDETAVIFSTPNNVSRKNLRIEIDKSAIQIPQEAEILYQSREALLSRYNMEIWRVNSREVNISDFAFLKYNLNQPQEAKLWIMEKEWSRESKTPKVWQNMALPQLLAPFGALILHASYIEVNGKAVLFTAASGTGKSTRGGVVGETSRGDDL